MASVFSRYTGIMLPSLTEVIVRDEYARVAWRVRLKDRVASKVASQLLGFTL